MKQKTRKQKHLNNLTVIITVNRRKNRKSYTGAVRYLASDFKEIVPPNHFFALLQGTFFYLHAYPGTEKF
jgi:hypothetical protein